MINLKKSLTVIVFLILSTYQFIAIAQGPDCCDRHAIISSCNSNDPMHILGSHDQSHDAFCSSIKTRLAELMTQDCFHFLNAEFVDKYRQKANEEGWGSLVKPANVPEHEYSFETEFESGLDESNEDGRPVRSKLIVKMYFEGEQREFVHSWEAQGTWDTVSNTGTSWSGHGNKLRNGYKRGEDIIEIIEGFEKRPVNLVVLPENPVVNVGEILEFDLTDFRDVFGETSRGFNRIVVHVYEGDILNGDICEIGPDYKVFRLNQGSIKVKYQAPSGCNASMDRITIYSSCDILPVEQSPIEDSEIKERILEKEFNINCPDATIRINKKYDKTLNSSDSDDSFDGSCKTHYEEEHTINESIDATVNLSLKLETVQDMPIFNQTWEYYKPVSVSLSNFNYNSKEHKYNASNNTGSGCANVRHETNIDFNRNAKNYEIEGEPYVTQTHWMLVIDNETGKAVKLIPSGYGISYKIHEQEKLNSVIYSDDGPQRNKKTSTRERDKSFKLGPVGEEISDPTVKSSNTWVQDYLKRQGVELPAGVNIPTPSNEDAKTEIHPDILVTSGDGLTSFGGRGENTIETEVENGVQEEKMNYTWQMTRKKPSQQ